MSLQFILGNSGCGKTRTMFKKVVELASENPRKDYLVIVPEQFTMATQRELVDLSPNKAIMNIDVLSFDRLAYRIFDELGKNDLNVLEDTGKNLVLRKVAQQKENELTVFRPNLNRMGYISEVKSLLSEFMQYQVSPETLALLIDGMDDKPLLKAKLNDVLTMYSGFRDYLEGKYVTAEDILSILESIADKSEILKNSVMVFDEFTGFTPSQNSLLKKLMQICDEIMVSLTIDSRENFWKSRGIFELFNMPKKTIHKLMEMADETNVEVKEPIIISGGEESRFKDSKALHFLEQNLFRRSNAQYKEQTKKVQLAVAKDPQSELMNVCRLINHLVNDEGYRYKDIAVVSGDVKGYGNYVENIFAKYNIPFFLDIKKEIVFQPFTELIRAAIEVVRTNYSYQSVFRFLRSGLTKLTEQEIDVLDNYALAAGINNLSKWKKRWVYIPKTAIKNTKTEEKLLNGYSIEELNELRKYVYELFLPLRESFLKKNECTVKEQVYELYNLIDGLKIQQQLEEKAQRYEDSGELVKAKEYGQIYQIIMDLFDKIADLLGDEILNITDFSEILDAGIDAAKVGAIPPEFDTVVVGDIERTRLNHVKVLMFVGVNDGIIPKASTGGGIISQFERNVLEEQFKIELAPGSREQTFIQKYYLYLNITKPSDRLYVSYHLLSSEGSAVRPSYLIGVLKRLFPNLEEAKISEEKILEDFSTSQTAVEYLTHFNIENLFEDEDLQQEKWLALAKFFMEGNSDRRRIIETFMEAKFFEHDDEPISHAVAQALYGRDIQASVTRLESYATCAYAHFLKYGLKLKEREISEFKSLDIGNIYHDALKIYSEKVEKSNYTWFNIPEDKRNELSDESLDEAVIAYENVSIHDSAENEHFVERMKAILQQTVWALTTQVRKGKFVPKDFEISFSQTDDLSAIQFALSEEERLKLQGRIDRLDTCSDEGNMYVKVIDYKSGNTKFDLFKVYEGLQLQLVVYMNAAMELQKKECPNASVIPGGILYYHIDDPVVETETGIEEGEEDEEIKEKILKKLIPNGLINSDEKIYRAFDDEFESQSDVAPISVNKNGSLSKKSKVATTDEFKIIEKYVDKIIARNGKEILNGRIAVNPYKNKNASGEKDSCEYCPFSGICGFDELIPGFKSRNYSRLEDEKIYEKMQTDIARLENEESKEGGN